MKTPVAFVPEHPDIELTFRRTTATNGSSPTLWADAYLAALANVAGGRLVTFGRAPAKRSTGAILLD
jgi:predicted nucleic acid-binding protein